MELRLTQNAIAGFQRLVGPASSPGGAHQALRRACRSGHFSADAPTWLVRVDDDNDGYLLLDGEVAALPIRRGRAVGCLANPTAGWADYAGRRSVHKDR